MRVRDRHDLGYCVDDKPQKRRRYMYCPLFVTVQSFELELCVLIAPDMVMACHHVIADLPLKHKFNVISTIKAMSKLLATVITS